MVFGLGLDFGLWQRNAGREQAHLRRERERRNSFVVGLGPCLGQEERRGWRERERGRIGGQRQGGQR